MVPRSNVRLAEDNLQLDEVQVVAHRKKDEITTSYTIDRKTLDNQQIMTLGDIAQLLPGGKSVNPSLMNDSKLTCEAVHQSEATRRLVQPLRWMVFV